MALLAGALMPTRAAPDARKYRLGFLAIGDADSFFGGARKELLGALEGLGYVLGRNLEVVECYEKESPEKLFECGRKLAALGVDVIVTEGTTSTLAARNGTRTIPIVTTVGDPVAAGFAASLRRPGGNITGLTQNRTEIARKQLELLRIMRPGIAAVAILWERPFPGVDILMKPAMEAAREASIATHEIVRDSADIAATLEQMRKLRIDCAFAIGGLERRALAAAVNAHVAIVSAAHEEVEEGALLAVEPDGSQSYAYAASTIDKILRGAAPADMPFQSATRYLTTINARTAAALGIRLTPELRLRAERVVD